MASAQLPWLSKETTMLWDSVMPDALNWEVGLRDVYRRDGTIIPNKSEVFRIDTDEHFNIVGNDYTPMQNCECAAFLQNLEGAVVEKAGVFGGGAKVWWALRLPGSIRIGNDEILKYSIMVNAHDGSLGFRWFVTPIRPKCSNMMNLLIRSAIDFSISARHTRNISTRVAEASRVFERVNSIYSEMEAAFNVLNNQAFDHENLQAYVAAVLQPTDVEHGRFKVAYERIEDNWDREVGRTAWTAMNAVTEYLDHQRPMRGTNQQERRFENAVCGSTAKLKQRAYNMIQEGPSGPNYFSYVSNRSERLATPEYATAESN
jgi:phage/plasmid-like protein (TIGR03299 family)